MTENTENSEAIENKDNSSDVKSDKPSNEQANSDNSKTGFDKPDMENDPLYIKEKEEIFKLYGEALDNADWAFKAKNGTERELGHKSVILAEKAYVQAGLYDKVMADKMYEDVTGRPPKPELQKRIDDAKSIDMSNGIPDLTAGLGSLRQKQELWSLTLEKKGVESQISAWEVSIGDTEQRRRQFQRQSADELLRPERLDQGDDSGLGMFIRSIKNGIKAGTDMRMARDHKRKEVELRGNVSDSISAHGDIVKKIASFTQEPGKEGPATNGPLGKYLQRFPGATGIVNAVTEAIKSRRNEAPGVEPEGNAPAKNPAAFHAARNAQDQGMQI